MKLTLVTADTQRARAWTQALEREDGSRQLRCVLKPLHELPYLVNGNVPDIAVLDLSDPRSLAALPGFAKAHSQVRCVLVGDELSDDLLVQARHQGVKEAVLASTDASDVALAVRRLGLPSAVKGQVVTFMGCKGGSGATFTAANLACLMAANGRRSVALLDLNLQLGDAHLYISNRRPPSDLLSLTQQIDRLDADLLRSAMLPVMPGLHVLAAPETAAPGAQVQPEQVRRIVDQARRLFELVIIDTSRVLDGVTLQALEPADRVCVVLQLALPSIRDAKRLQQVLGTLGLPAQKVHWIVNRCQAGGPITLQDVRRVLGVDELLTLPNQYDVVARSVNQGIPVTTLAPRSRITQALQRLATRMDVAQAPQPGRSGWFAGLLRGGAFQ